MGTNKKLTRMIVSQNIKNAMIMQKITRQKMSDDLEIKYTTVCDWVRGRTSPNLYYLKKVIDYLGLDMAKIYETNESIEIPMHLKLRLLRKELNNNNNIIKINDELYIKKDNIERIVNYEQSYNNR